MTIRCVLLLLGCIVYMVCPQTFVPLESVKCGERGCNSSPTDIQSSSVYTAIMFTSNLTGTVDSQAYIVCTFYSTPSMKIHSSFHITRNNITTLFCSGGNTVYSIQNETKIEYDLPYYCYQFQVTNFFKSQCQLFSNDLSGSIQFRVPTLDYIYTIVFLP